MVDGGAAALCPWPGLALISTSHCCQQQEQMRQALAVTLLYKNSNLSSLSLICSFPGMG